jgi:hypothetical protein
MSALEPLLPLKKEQQQHQHPLNHQPSKSQKDWKPLELLLRG